MIPRDERDVTAVAAPLGLHVKIVSARQNLRPEPSFGIHDRQAIVAFVVRVQIRDPTTIG